MIDETADRFLAKQYLRNYDLWPPDRGQLATAEKTIRTFMSVGLLKPEDADSWRRSLAILSGELPELPLASDRVRGAARAYLASVRRQLHDVDEEDDSLESDALRFENAELWDGVLALRRVGALTWRDVDDDPFEPPDLEIERIIAAPPHPTRDVVVSTVHLLERGLRVDWYAAQAITPRVWDAYRDDADGGPAELEIVDDLGTRYMAKEWGASLRSSSNAPTMGSTGYEPAPPDGASELIFSRNGIELIRVSLL